MFFKFKPSQVRIRSIFESIESVEAKTPDGSRWGVRRGPFLLLPTTIYFILRALGCRAICLNTKSEVKVERY